MIEADQVCTNGLTTDQSVASDLAGGYLISIVGNIQIGVVEVEGVESDAVDAVLNLSFTSVEELVSIGSAGAAGEEIVASVSISIGGGVVIEEHTRISGEDGEPHSARGLIGAAVDSWLVLRHVISTGVPALKTVVADGVILNLVSAH